MTFFSVVRLTLENPQLIQGHAPVTDELEAWLPRVYRFALRLTGDLHAAEDLAQETLLRAWDRRRQLRDAASTRVWLFRIAANLWRDALRRRRLPAGSPGPFMEDYPCSAATQETTAEDTEELQRALAAMNALPPRQREVLYLFACEDLTLAEIADVLDITTEAAKASLSQARQKLRQQFATDQVSAQEKTA